MNDEQMRLLLKAWFQARKAAPTDVLEGVARVVARVPATRQRGRRWPLPAFDRPVSTLRGRELAPAPTPVTNGRTRPRGSTMFSVVKFVVASVIVALFGGLLLAGSLMTPRADERAPTAATESSSPMTKIEATHVSGSLSNYAGTFTPPGSVAGVVTSDPRLDGCYVAQSDGGSAVASWGTLKVFDRCSWVWPDERSVLMWEGGWFLAGRAPGTVSVFGEGLGTVWLDGREWNEGWSASMLIQDGTLDAWLFPTPVTTTVPAPGL